MNGLKVETIIDWRKKLRMKEIGIRTKENNIDRKKNDRKNQRLNENERKKQRMKEKKEIK